MRQGARRLGRAVVRGRQQWCNETDRVGGRVRWVIRPYHNEWASRAKIEKVIRSLTQMQTPTQSQAQTQASKARKRGGGPRPRIRMEEATRGPPLVGDGLVFQWGHVRQRTNF